MTANQLAAVVACLLHAAVARADSAANIELSRCVTWGDELRAAMTAELAPIANRGNPVRTVVVSCPDLVTARLEIQPAPPGGPLIRNLDLGDIPTPLRIRLIALAAAELVDVANRIAGRPPTPEPAPRDPVPHALAPPGLLPPSLVEPTSLRSFALTSRVGARVHTRVAIPMFGVGGDAELGQYALGAFIAATTRFDDPLGQLQAWTAGVGAAVTVACTGQRFGLCASLRVEGGVAVVTARTAVSGVMAASATAPYGSVGGEIGASWPFGRWTAIATLGGAYAKGLVAYSGDRTAVRLDGPLVTATFGARWRP